ncbi:hypothetical protein JR316_0008404 [Psilocybe cubensis]|uniref:Uncharacterized protein n=2 Tax=Psilocybe cubensis TaxID=181762 RepID=A0ACB8GXR9_PSICU|nr:hypothetical protein JR316_0008404 [Psilocybe cubensis]KAH9479809.1 hypothetical protein JR316_0008404 [Psilocybe cubensis]
MNQCIRRLLSNSFKPWSNRRAVSTIAATVEEEEKWLELERKKLHRKYSLRIPPPARVGTSFLPAFPLPPRRPVRGVDKTTLDELYETLAFLLRNHAARDYGLSTRPDGYLSVSKLLNYPIFRGVDFFKLHDLANRGRKYHIHIIYDPTKIDGPWWIRCQKFQEEHFVYRPALLSNANGVAVYRTSLQLWDSYISRTGIARHNDEWIRLDPYVPNKSYIDSLEDEDEVFIFLDIHDCLLHGLRFFYELHTSQKRNATTPLMTKGDLFGNIPPSMFSRVLFVQATKKHAWGLDPLAAQKSWTVEPDDLDEYGMRKTFLPAPPRPLHAFVDFRGAVRPPHPETIQEATSAVNTT